MLPRDNQRQRVCIIVAMVIAMAWQSGAAHAGNADRIRPYSQHPSYWQYKGKPVMLLGGSKTDHIFLLEDLKDHLDEIHAAGANYVRNTMSQREGVELKPHKLLPDGTFDMNQWNEEYWQRFQHMLKWTAEREIVVQIEVWDRFDYAEENWQISPWNPRNNINYDDAQSGFSERYSNSHLYSDAHPFFHTIKGTSRYAARYDLIRKHQEAFVDKMLSYSLPYGHVLYCMNNETSSEAGWGQFWIQFIKKRAAQEGVTVWTTDMFDDAFQGADAKHAPVVFDDPEHYMFADISQVNSRNYDQAHWDTLQSLLRQINKHPRPSNHTKIYGSGYHSFGTGGPEDGVERFWRNILGGSASARFHRPNAGMRSLRHPLVEGFCAACKPADRRPPWEWCEEHVQVDETSPLPGRWRSDASPWVRAVMEDFSNNAIRDIAVQCAAQSAKTQTVMNCACWAIAEDPGPAMWVTATKDELRDFMRDRLTPTFETCRPVKERVGDARRTVGPGPVADHW